MIPDHHQAPYASLLRHSKHGPGSVFVASLSISPHVPSSHPKPVRSLDMPGSRALLQAFAYIISSI